MIYKVSLDGSNRTSFEAGTFFSEPNAIAIDWLGRHLYVASKKSRTIEVVQLTANDPHHKIVMSYKAEETSVATPIDIVLDPARG